MMRGVAAPAATRAMRLWAGVDLGATGAFALPPLAPHFISLIYALNGALGGIDTAPPFEAVHGFFVCLAGALGVLWALVRLVWPLPPLGLADALGRLWVAGLILYFVFVAGAPRILLAFVVTEVAGSAHQWTVLRAHSRGHRRR